MAAFTSGGRAGSQRRRAAEPPRLAARPSPAALRAGCPAPRHGPAQPGIGGTAELAAGAAAPSGRSLGGSETRKCILPRFRRPELGSGGGLPEALGVSLLAPPSLCWPRAFPVAAGVFAVAAALLPLPPFCVCPVKAPSLEDGRQRNPARPPLGTLINRASHALPPVGCGGAPGRGRRLSFRDAGGTARPTPGASRLRITSPFSGGRLRTTRPRTPLTNVRNVTGPVLTEL